MPPQNAFDAFLSYNDKDRPVVRQIGEELRSRGLKLWFDEWELRPGGVIQDAKAEIIETVSSAVIFVSDEGFTPWQSTELRAAIDQFIERKIPVIPVLLPGAAADVKLPLFLRQFSWVDMRAGVTDAGFDALQWGITGVKPTPRAATMQTRRMTVVELDLAGYSDILRHLEEGSTVESATEALSKQIDGFLNAGIAAAQVRREETLMSVAGDGAILIFENAAQAHHFARGVHDATEKYNATKTVDSAKRWFRIGAATGEIVVNVPQKKIGGITIANAVRLEAAAAIGQLLIDKATHAALPADLQALYGDEETVRGKRDEQFAARRCAMAQSALPISPKPSDDSSGDSNMNPSINITGDGNVIGNNNNVSINQPVGTGFQNQPEGVSLSAIDSRFQKLETQMPKLLDEMRTDLRNSPLRREFVLMKQGLVYWRGGNELIYYFEDHADLMSKILILQNLGLIRETTCTNVKRFVMLEELADYLTSASPVD